MTDRVQGILTTLTKEASIMKKILALIAILLISISVYAIDTSLTLGYQEKTTGSHIHDPIYISIDLWQDIGNLRLYGNYTNEMSKSLDSWMFAPSQDYFTVGATYDFTVFRFAVEHMCQHSVVSGGVNKGLSGGYTKFEITIGD
jgi:hypothetical protein